MGLSPASLRPRTLGVKSLDRWVGEWRILDESLWISNSRIYIYIQYIYVTYFYISVSNIDGSYDSLLVPWIILVLDGYLCILPQLKGPTKTLTFKGQLGVPLTVYPWYLLCSLRILGDQNKIPIIWAYIGISHRGPPLGSGLHPCLSPETFPPKFLRQTKSDISQKVIEVGRVCN